MAEEAVFGGEDVDGGEEALEAVEGGGAFGGEQVGFAFFAGVVPALGDAGGVFGGVYCADAGKAGLAHEAFIFAGGAVGVKADGAAGGDFFGGNHSGDYESVSEEEAAAGFQDAEDFGEDAEPAGNVAQNIV